MLQINTSTLKSRKKVLIDGHPYTVRKLGAGEQLTLSQYMREIEKLGQREKLGSLTDDEERRALDISQKTMDIMVGIFDDGGDGEKSRKLVKQLSAEELQDMITSIFEETQVEPEVS